MGSKLPGKVVSRGQIRTTAASSAPAAAGAAKWNTKVNGVGVKGFANESTA